MRKSLFLNGVYESVLEEILEAQKEYPNKIFYLQPYSSHTIRLLADNAPSEKKPIPLYISTTTDLDKICFEAKVVGWENKQELSQVRLDELNKHIKQYQPNEEEIYLKVGDSECINLISICDLNRLPNKYSVKNLIKTGNDEPLKPRAQPGKWSYVKELPEWLRLEKSTTEENLQEELDKGIEESTNLDDETRRRRISKASEKPEPIQVISKGYRRNPDVIVEVLKRADGKCERCGNKAPFKRASDGSPYLEVHHWTPLSEGGSDTVNNAGALCPNCHREVHYGNSS